MVTAHIGRNLRRYAVGAAATGAAAVAAKPAGKQAGKASVGKSDPYYDMNRRAGESIFHSRKSKIDSSRLKRRGGLAEAGSRTFGKGLGRAGRYAKLKLKPDEGLGKAVGTATSKTLKSIKPGPRQIVPAVATVGAAAIVGKRAKSGADQGRYDKRRSGTQRGYTDAYKKTYGRQEGIDEARMPTKAARGVRRKITRKLKSVKATSGARKIAGKLKSVQAHPSTQKAQQAVRWGGRGVAALDLAVLGASGTAVGVKAVRNRKNREEGLDEAGAGSAVRVVRKSIQRHQDKKVVRYLNRNKSRRGGDAVRVARKQATADTLLKVGTGAGATAAGVDIARRRTRQDEGLTEGRIKGSGLRKVGGYIEKGDVGLFGISTGRAITNKGRDVADDQQLNQSHLRRK